MNTTLTEYKQKRNFNDTPEPDEVSNISKKSALSFVVQRHDASHLHYDFRLEMEGVLKSWAIPKGPSMIIGEKRLAIMVEDHPLEYGKFYGEIPEGNYGAGIVEIWDKGTYSPMEDMKSSAYDNYLLDQLKKGDLKFILKGKYLKGAFALVRMKEDNWLLIKKKDDNALESFDIEALKPIQPCQKKNNLTTKEKYIPKNYNWETLQKPMLAKLTNSIKNNKDWIYEMKYDGYRAITGVHHGQVNMKSRKGISFNLQYPPLIQELKHIKDDIVMDGEIVIENKNSRQYFGSLILGVYENQKLVYIGNCGSGFTEASLKALHEKFSTLETETCPFAIEPKMRGLKGKVTWLHPTLVCNIHYSKLTQDNFLRHPVFAGLRTDKKATEITQEIPFSQIKTNAYADRK